MMKKLVAGTIVLIILGTSNTLAYANPTTNKEIKGEKVKSSEVVKQSFEVVIPEKEFQTSEKNLVLSFRAPEGTKVTIEVYHNVSEEEGKEEYELSYDPIEVTVGTLQRGWAEVELQSGMNKIEFIAVYKDGLKEEDTRIVNVLEVEEVKQLLEEIVNKSTLGVGKKP